MLYSRAYCLSVIYIVESICSFQIPFAVTWMDLKIIILSGVNQTEKYKYYMISLICGISIKMMQMNLSTKEKQTHRNKNKLLVTKG